MMAASTPSRGTSPENTFCPAQTISISSSHTATTTKFWSTTARVITQTYSAPNSYPAVTTNRSSPAQETALYCTLVHKKTRLGCHKIHADNCRFVATRGDLQQPV